MGEDAKIRAKRHGKEVGDLWDEIDRKDKSDQEEE